MTLGHVVLRRCMAIRDYWRRVRRRTWQSTAKFLGLESFKQIMFRALGAVVALILLWQWGSQGSAHDDLLVRLGLAAIIICVAPFVYVWNFVRAPALLDAEAAQVRGELEAKLEDRTKRQAQIGEAGTCAC